MEQYPHAGATKGVLILRVVGPLCFANMEHIRDCLAEHEVSTHCFVLLHLSMHSPIYDSSCFGSQQYKVTVQATIPQATVPKPAGNNPPACGQQFPSLQAIIPKPAGTIPKPAGAIPKPAGNNPRACRDMTCCISCVSCYTLTMLVLSNNVLCHSSHTA